MKKIKTVFLDAGGTLFQPHPSVGAIYAETARKHGHGKADADDLEARFRDAWHHTNGLGSLGKISDKVEREWWYGLVRHVFKGEEKQFRDFDVFFTDLYDLFARPEVWRLFDDAVPTILELKRRGYRLAMVSNWDHRLQTIVEGLGLTGHFETIVSSSGVGVAKPGRVIFETALARMSAHPEETVHVGDSLEDDYHGARNAGLEAILLNRHGKPYNDIRHIQSLHAILSMIE